MGPVLSALVDAQTIERDLSQLRRRKRARRKAVRAQEARIFKLREENDALRQSTQDRRKQADEHELNLRASEEYVAKMRVALNTAKTNKEYASILTQINTHRADNAKIEEQTLKILAEVDRLKTQVETVETQVQAEEGKLADIRASNADRIAKIEAMIRDLQGKRDKAAQALPPTVLAIFNRLAEQYDGEAMAKVVTNGRRPPYTYTCDGCYMSLNAEHANALRSRDEIRQCDNCQRILYFDPADE